MKEVIGIFTLMFMLSIYAKAQHEHHHTADSSHPDVKMQDRMKTHPGHGMDTPKNT